MKLDSFVIKISRCKIIQELIYPYITCFIWIIVVKGFTLGVAYFYSGVFSWYPSINIILQYICFFPVRAGSFRFVTKMKLFSDFWCQMVKVSIAPRSRLATRIMLSNHVFLPQAKFKQYVLIHNASVISFANYRYISEHDITFGYFTHNNIQLSKLPALTLGVSINNKCFFANLFSGFV